MVGVTGMGALQIGEQLVSKVMCNTIGLLSVLRRAFAYQEKSNRFRASVKLLYSSNVSFLTTEGTNLKLKPYVGFVWNPSFAAALRVAQLFPELIFL